MAEEMNTPLPSLVCLNLTEMCNLRCTMCYWWGDSGTFSRDEASTKPASLDYALAQKVIAELAVQRPRYSLFGGEPLMYPRLEELIVTIKEAGSFIDTPTNGTFLSENARMLVDTGFDSIRVSLDGPRDVNDAQRGRGSYEKATNGIETLNQEKMRAGSAKPGVHIIFTVTPDNYLSIERFFLHELNLDAIDSATVLMQNYITEEMGRAYAGMLESEFGITSDRFWRGMVRHPDDFAQIDSTELSRQAGAVRKHFYDLQKVVRFLPPTFSAKNLSAYLSANWENMSDSFNGCPAPWHGAEITVTGDVAPCHAFYDLTMGNLHDKSFEEIWNGKKYRRFRTHLKKNGLMSICPGCCVYYEAGMSQNQ